MYEKQDMFRQITDEQKDYMPCYICMLIFKIQFDNLKFVDILVSC